MDNQTGKKVIHMDNFRKIEFSKIITPLCVLFDKEPTKEFLEIYYLAVQDIGIPDLRNAVLRWLNSEKRFPTPADLRSMLRPSDQHQAREAVSRIVESVTKWGDPYGHSQERALKAQEYIGELGWLVIARYFGGSWANISSASEEDINPMAQAQWREFLVSASARDRLGLKDAAPMLPSSYGSVKQLTSMSTVLNKLIDR
jgi:hypothetical protein